MKTIQQNTEEAEPPNQRQALQSLSPRESVFPERTSAFSASSHAKKFRTTFFPEASHRQWHDWHWQLQNRITSVKQLEKIIRLTEDERRTIGEGATALPLSITPYYASLLDPLDPSQSIRRSVVPVSGEFLHSPGEAEDPLGEDNDCAVPGLIHRYPDRVLFLVTDFCSNYCRYCTRSRLVGRHSASTFNPEQWQKALDYIASNPNIRDVLLSGGDPLTLPDEKLDWLLGRLRLIPHVELIRIGTKVPMVLPQRITPGLVKMLKRHHPLWISIHCTHPVEHTPEVTTACARLANAGIPLGSQTVLLKGINDDIATMKQLVHGLLRLRIKPYYLYQCDPIIGSAHFRTTVDKGLEIYQGLRGHTTGYAVPNYVIDAPGGGGKIPLLPQTVVGREGNDILLRNYQGNIYRYPDQREPGMDAEIIQLRKN